MRPSKGGYREAGHVDQLVDGYRPRLTPGNLVRILAKGQSSTDLIHTESAQVFRSFGHLLARPRGGRRSSARPPPKPEHAAARSARGRQPFKHGTVPVTILMVVKVLGGWRRPGPSLSALPKGPAQRPEAGPPRGCSGVPRTSFCPHPPPAVLFRGQRQGEESPNTHRTNAGGQQDGRGRAPPGSSTPTQASCAEEITIGAHPVGPSVNGPGCFDGRGGCDRPRCPASDY
jgi:hypothetical protein